MLGLVYSIHALVVSRMPAVLQSAAGGDQGKLKKDAADGFTDVVTYMSKLSDYLIPVGAGFAVLGLIYGGCLLMAGAPHAGRTLTYVIVGVVVVLSSKGLAL